MQIGIKDLDKYEKEADQIGAAIARQTKAIEQVEKQAPAATKKKLAPIKKAAAEAVKQGKAAQKAIATAKKKNGADEKANKDLQVQVAKAAKATAAAQKHLAHEAWHVVQQIQDKVKPKDVEKAFDDKAKFWKNLEKKTK